MTAHADDVPFLRTTRTATGNVSQSAKDALCRWYRGATEKRRFAKTITGRLEATEMHVLDKPEEAGKKEATLVFELDVTEEMCHFGDSMHGGCTALLIDFCSSVALSLLATEVAPDNFMHVSLVLTTIYHAPAPLGCRLKIINTSVALGNRTGTARTEIYDKTNNRLVASGVHVKMPPSAPKL